MCAGSFTSFWGGFEITKGYLTIQPTFSGVPKGGFLGRFPNILPRVRTCCQYFGQFARPFKHYATFSDFFCNLFDILLLFGHFAPFCPGHFGPGADQGGGRWWFRDHQTIDRGNGAGGAGSRLGVSSTQSTPSASRVASSSLWPRSGLVYLVGGGVGCSSGDVCEGKPIFRENGWPFPPHFSQDT